MANPIQASEGQVKVFADNIKRILAELESEIKPLLANFDFANGILLPSPENTAKMTILMDDIAIAMEDLGYYDLLENAIAGDYKIYKARAESLRKIYKQPFGKFDDKSARALLSTNYDYMNNVVEDGLSRIQKTVYNSVIIGQSLEESALEIQSALKTGLYNNAITEMRTIKRQFLQNVENGIADSIGFDSKNDIWEYFGAPLQTNSHPECIWAITEKAHAPYFTTDEKNEFENGGGLPHTEPRYNCQHLFLISDLTYEDYLKT